MSKKKVLSRKSLSLLIILVMIFPLSSCSIGEALKTLSDELSPLNSYLNNLARDQNPVEQPQVHITEEFHPISYDHKYGYKSLAPDQKQVYDRIHAAVINYHRFIDLRESPVSSDDLFRIFYYYIDDHPESFWLYPQITKYFYNERKELCIGALLRYMTQDDMDEYNSETDELKNKPSDEKLTRAREDFNAKINTLLSILSPNDDPLTKEIKIYSHMAENIKYDEDLAAQILSENIERPISQSAYGAAIEKSTVCTGFTKLFLLLMNSVGIECLIQHGTLEGTGHVWNVIRIDGEYYNVDVTQAASTSPKESTSLSIDYTFFNTTDQVIQKTHIIKPFTLSNGLVQVSYDVPPCISEDKTFETLFSVRVKENTFNEKDFAEKIKQLHIYNLSAIYFIFPDGTPHQTVRKFLETHGHQMQNLSSRYFRIDEYFAYNEKSGKASIKLHKKQ